MKTIQTNNRKKVPIQQF